jgi:hypothetical protein
VPPILFRALKSAIPVHRWVCVNCRVEGKSTPGVFQHTGRLRHWTRGDVDWPEPQAALRSQADGTIAHIQNFLDMWRRVNALR